MLSYFKINTAILICSAFILRLLFVNIGIISSLSSQQSNKVQKYYLSVKTKKRRNVESQSNTFYSDNSPMEVCEEECGEKDQLKLTSLPFIQVLYSFSISNLKSKPETQYSFAGNSSCTSSPRFITYQVFRI